MWLQGECYEFRKAVPRKWLRLGAAADQWCLSSCLGFLLSVAGYLHVAARGVL